MTDEGDHNVRGHRTTFRLVFLGRRRLALRSCFVFEHCNVSCLDVLAICVTTAILSIIHIMYTNLIKYILIYIWFTLMITIVHAGPDYANFGHYLLDLARLAMGCNGQVIYLIIVSMCSISLSCSDT